MKSSRSDLPRGLAAALERSRPRLGVFASDVRYLTTTESTNDVAAALDEGSVVVAAEQTAGRGRRGHTWFSPAGSGLYVSVVLAPSRARPDPTRATRLLTLTIGVALAEAIEAAAGLKSDLRWPNDLYVGRRKLAGILAEASAASAFRIVAGFGINVRRAAYPPDLDHRATSIETELGRPVDGDELLVETLASIATRYDDLLGGRFDAILDAWRVRAAGTDGRRVRWSTMSGFQSGVTAGVDACGALLVRADDRPSRVVRIVAGEVIWE